MGDRPTVTRCSDVGTFMASASDLLVAAEAQHARTIGVLGWLSEDPEAEADLLVVEEEHGVVGAAVRTPPWPLQLSRMDASAARALAHHLADEAVHLGGVIGPVEAARAFARTWSEVNGTETRAGMQLRNFACTAVRQPRTTTGRMRPAEPRDREVLIAWLVAFHDEAVPDDPLDASAVVDRWLDAPVEKGGLWLWEDSTGPVAMAGTTGATPNGIRVLAVYTPESSRGCGYASNLVAAVSQAELDRGRRLVFLSTDLTNPASNSIYTAIGYEPVGDEHVIRFTPRRRPGLDVDHRGDVHRSP